MTEDSPVERVLRAALKAGSLLYVEQSGATQEEMRRFAAEGLLQEMAAAFSIHVALHPLHRARLAHSVPAMVRNRYWFDHLGIDQRRIGRWCGDNPDWSERLRSALASPSRFDAVSRSMAEAIGAHDGN